VHKRHDLWNKCQSERGINATFYVILLIEVEKQRNKFIKSSDSFKMKVAIF